MGLFTRLRRGRRSDAVPAAADAADAAVPPAPPESGWATVRPVQRVLGAPRLTAEREFAASLTTRQPLLFTGGLGHEVSASAPSGLVRDALTPAPASAPNPAHPPVPVLRPAGLPGRPPATADAEAAHTRTPVQRSAPTPV
ncbi:hypothetical protein AB0J65_28090, partial [Streptomyces toxytricini]